MTETTDDATVSPRLPRWVVIAIAAASAVLATIGATIALIVASLVSVAGEPTLGPARAADLVPGACLAQSDTVLEAWTVVDCSTSPAQQVVAEIDLSRNTESYSTPAALTAFADEICDRFLEYGLFVPESVTDRTHDLVAVAVPTPEAVAAGDARALCAIRTLDGTPLPGSLFRAMP